MVRPMTRVVVHVLILMALVACGAPTASVPGDESPPPSKAPPQTTGIDCPTAPCNTGEQCCAVPASTQLFACAAACPAPVDELACLRPSDCGGTTPTCCATAALTGTGLVTATTCKLESVGTACVAAASCPASLTASCGAAEAGPLCSTAADCTAGNSCCSVTISGAAFFGCVTSDLATLGGLSCL
jgi:hypothetical protein